jgi:nitrate reductase cytochrome c-type subunit
MTKIYSCFTALLAVVVAVVGNEIQKKVTYNSQTLTSAIKAQTETTMQYIDSTYLTLIYKNPPPKY